MEAAAAAGNDQAGIALAAFAYRTRKYIGDYAAAMGGLDAITIAGGAGEGSAAVRTAILSGLELLGVEVDPARNGASGERIVSADGSRIKVAGGGGRRGANYCPGHVAGRHEPHPPRSRSGVKTSVYISVVSPDPHPWPLP